MVSFAKPEEAAICRLEILKRERKFPIKKNPISRRGSSAELCGDRISSWQCRLSTRVHRPPRRRKGVAPASAHRGTCCSGQPRARIPSSDAAVLPTSGRMNFSKPPSPEPPHRSVTNFFPPLCAFVFVSNLHIATIAVFVTDSGSYIWGVLESIPSHTSSACPRGRSEGTPRSVKSSCLRPAPDLSSVSLSSHSALPLGQQHKQNVAVDPLSCR